MKRINFLVQGSSAEPYEVCFLKDGKKLNAYCNCSAGKYGKHCKHRINILCGSDKGIVSENIDEVNTIKNWLINTDLEAILKEYLDADKKANIAKRKLASAKKELTRIMLE